jgi:hypothetical protein
MIELGIREFRERLSEVANGNDFVVVKNNGVEVGTYMPKRWLRDVGKAKQAAAAVAKVQKELRKRGIDLDREMAEMGLTPYGEPLKNDA